MNRPANFAAFAAAVAAELAAQGRSDDPDSVEHLSAILAESPRFAFEAEYSTAGLNASDLKAAVREFFDRPAPTPEAPKRAEFGGLSAAEYAALSPSAKLTLARRLASEGDASPSANIENLKARQAAGERLSPLQKLTLGRSESVSPTPAERRDAAKKAGNQRWGSQSIRTKTVALGGVETALARESDPTLRRHLESRRDALQAEIQTLREVLK